MLITQPEVKSAPVCAGVVLVADDDAWARSSTSEILRKAGYDCREAADAFAAAEIVRTGECDLIIADIQMPGNNALELVRDLSGSATFPAVILATGHPSVETAAMAVRCNVLGYLVKPVVPDDLLRLVREGVDAAQILRHFRKRRGSVEQLLAEMRRIEEAGSSILRQRGQEALSTYLALSMEHILSSITDLRNLVEAIASRENAPRASERLAEARPFLLLDALREVIQVLERTKGSFKSRELAELRRKLEQLLTAERPGATRHIEPARAGEQL